jgi:hypothetical protein
MALLYKLTFASGKSYIGQTVRSMRTRLAQHRRSVRANSAFAVHLAWAKYGEPEVCLIGSYDDVDALNQAERDAINSYDTLSPSGYNIAYGGETAPSKSPEVARKIANKAKGRKHSEQVKKLMAKAIADQWQNPDYRSKVHEGVARSWTPEKRGERSELMKKIWEKRKAEGFVVAASTKEKLSAREVTPEWRAKMSKAAKERDRAPRSLESREKMADTIRKQWQNPEIKARRLAAMSAARARRREQQTEYMKG